jgi:hypothetical protein
VRRPSPKPKSDWPKLETKTTKSAFDDGESYELTALGSQFVHYAMTEITVKLEYRSEEEDEDSNTASAEPSV